MTTTQLLLISALSFIVLLIISILVFNARVRSLRDKLHTLELNEQQSRRHIQQFEEELHEVRSGAIGLGDKVKELISQINATQIKQEELAAQDPQSRFYNQAAKLVSSGSSVEDVMRECDIPRAEAELLFNLHQK
jgi:peptidoglycan hydrolase CwlO-like protein